LTCFVAEDDPITFVVSVVAVRMGVRPQFLRVYASIDKHLVGFVARGVQRLEPLGEVGVKVPRVKIPLVSG
jgi:hypothetical protein